MALGEYVSVSAQRDTEQALIAKERSELEDDPDAELVELVGLLQRRGLSEGTAAVVAQELTEHDPLAAHLNLELSFDEEDIANPWIASLASAVAFTVGALLPLVAILLPPVGSRIPVAFIAVLVALIRTGALSARLGLSPLRPAIIRLVTGGALAMAATFGIGALLDVAVS